MPDKINARLLSHEAGLSAGQRNLLTALLAATLLLVGLDLVEDFSQGASWGHLALEGFTGLAAGAGLAVVIRNNIRQRKVLITALKDGQHWKEINRRSLAGLGAAIDLQLQQWGLSPAEKEVAWLLIKGLSLKEIAVIRKTSEKTARAQAVEVYAKSGNHSRAELAAFFLEDLFAGKVETAPLVP